MLLLIDGFDAYGTSIGSGITPTDIMARKYATGSLFYYTVAAGRHGYALDTGINGYSYQFGPIGLTTADTVILGFAAKFDVLPAAYTFYNFFDGYSDRNVKCVLLNTGEIQVLNDSNTVLGTTSGAGIGTGTWYYIETKLKTHVSAGTVEIHVNGASVLSITGVVTQVHTHNYSDGFIINSIAGTHFLVDDLYFLDNTGPKNNTFLGDCSVVTLTPSAVGDVNAWTGSTGVSHYTLVNENPVDDDTTYIESSTSTQEELWNYTDPSGVTTVAGVQVCTDCRVTSGTPYTLETQIKVGGTDSSDAGQAISLTSYATVRRVIESNPHTANSWNPSDLNSTQFGVKVA